MRRALLAVAFAALVAASPRVARANDPGAAEALYQSGKDAARRGDWNKACADLGESQRLDPAPGTLINLADCEEHRGQLAAAYAHFVDAGRQFRPGDPRVAYAEDRARKLDKRVPRLTVTVAAGAPASARVFRDGEELGAASIGVPLPVDPGKHVIVVKVGGDQTRTEVDVGEGERSDVVANTPGQAAEPATSDVPPPEGHRTLGWIFVGAGGVALLVGGVAGVAALNDASDVKRACGPDYATCTAASVDTASSGQTLATVSTIGFVAGALLAGVGAYLVLTSHPSPASRGAAITLTPAGVGGVF